MTSVPKTFLIGSSGEEHKEMIKMMVLSCPSCTSPAHPVFLHLFAHTPTPATHSHFETLPHTLLETHPHTLTYGPPASGHTPSYTLPSTWSGGQFRAMLGVANSQYVSEEDKVTVYLEDDSPPRPPPRPPRWFPTLDPSHLPLPPSSSSTLLYPAHQEAEGESVVLPQGAPRFTTTGSLHCHTQDGRYGSQYDLDPVELDQQYYRSHCGDDTQLQYLGDGDFSNSSGIFPLDVHDERLCMDDHILYEPGVVHHPSEATTHLSHTQHQHLAYPAYDSVGVEVGLYPTYENVYVQVGEYLVSRSEATHAPVNKYAVEDEAQVLHDVLPFLDNIDDAESLYRQGQFPQETSFWLHQEAAVPLMLQQNGLATSDFEGNGNERNSVQAVVDESLAGLDNPALEHSEETQAHVDRLALALGDNIRSQIDNTLARIDNTRTKFNQQRRPFSNGCVSTTDPVIKTPLSIHRKSDERHLSDNDTLPRALHHPLLRESLRANVLSVTDGSTLGKCEVSGLMAMDSEADSDSVDNGPTTTTTTGEGEAPLARQETMMESVREYDDLSITTLLTMDTTTPHHTPPHNSLQSLKSLQSHKSRRSWVSVTFRGSSVSSPVICLDHHHSTVSDDDSGGGGSDGEGGMGGGVGGGLGGMGGGAGGVEHRTVYLNEPQPHKYCSNAVCTAKYRFKLLFFLPMFLFEQFRRYANQIPGVSPTGRYTTLVPLICILVVSAIKEIAEDIKRHRADDELNKREIEVLKDGHEPQALCYVETANLDGETNLKIRQGLPQTSNLLEARDLMNLSGKVECEAPNRFLYQFTGNLKQTSRPATPLSPDHVLLRGAKLQNTNWVFGLVVYTGHETKLMKNSATSAPLKRSTVDKQTNNLIILLFFLLIVLCLIMAVCNSQWDAKLHWYLSIDAPSSSLVYHVKAPSSSLVYHVKAPSSSLVYHVKAPAPSLVYHVKAHAGFINNDTNMVYEENDIWAMARTSNLNEELGMIKYVLSDKTGTLTCNIMEFKRCSIGGTVYSMDDGSCQDLVTLVESGGAGASVARQFLTMLGVCHTVIPDRDESRGDGSIIYHAASPDERALVEGARELGFVFETRTPECCIIDVLGSKEQYEVLNVLEFTSARKRMSVIVKTPDGQIKLYCKGADTVIYERLGDSQQFRDLTVRHLEEFAAEGLRTLCYAEWKNTYYKASTALQFRERKLEDAAQLIENNLTLLGATAIEDRLQDEVPETIAALLKAGIHVWVLTGDKQETAINIGHSCHLLNQGMPLIILNTESLDETRDAINRHVVEFGEQLKRENEAALIIDGKTLIYALTPDLRKDFLDLCISCKSVVELLTRETGSVTLAIGDGANDVAMIQKANVGVGIAGLEGLQAACASDYAIGQFRFLARLLFVHGAWNYSRLCKVILYSFYKNICLYVIELWWAAMSGWSGQVLFERWSIAMYNVLFTAAPPLVMGIFDRSCSAETRMKYPELYRESQSGSHFNWKVFVWWVWLALVHSVLVFVLPYLSMTQDVAWGHGRVGGYLMTGNMVYTYVVITVCLKAGLETDAWTWVTHLAIWGSIASWFIFLLVYSNFWPILPMAPDMCGIYLQVYSSPVFWFGVILIPLACLLPDIVVKTIRNSICKSLTEQVRESEISNKDVSKVLDTKHR
ncbi:Phospholipid-transporting ATPase IA-like [Homarus americanus]|uniref:Phospholipid-transporting ATPase n=1 Tax=Homarus americanus TaxID=6706 RepID=A0A8J5MSQ1_HOMAM|nr:Phospholipid-transporting ATPase IA-like [Homarus americanus]